MPNVARTGSVNDQTIAEFRANAGRVGGRFDGVDLLLITSIGARSGRRHTSPVVHVVDGGRYVVAASNGGADRNPDWYHNVVADPRVVVEVGERRFEATAAVVTDAAERDRLFAALVAAVPALDATARRTERVIPVVVFTP
jgi:deazaflavin-dependent oxidoreductase (nitroreductase family)